MIKSMTGYGKADGLINTRDISVEIRSLNSKSMDLSLRLPSAYKAFEMEIRSMVSAKLVRGKIEVSIRLTDGNGHKSSINKPMIKSYFEELVMLEEEMGSIINDKLTLALSMPEAMITEREVADKEEWIQLKSIIENALQKIDDYRANEGATLKGHLLGNAQNILQLKNDIIPKSENRLEKIKERIRNSLQTNLEEISVDENRFEQELIYYIEKIDVNEELIRLQGNMDYFVESAESVTSEGKKLRFISQEIGREINTLGAKSYDAEMQKTVVMMKDELEKIKEQLLNVL